MTTLRNLTALTLLLPFALLAGFLYLAWALALSMAAFWDWTMGEE